jgi:hypothetical protein
MSRKKISTTIYVTPEQSEKLKLLHERTKVPVAVYIREGIDLVLRHYGNLLPGQLPLDGGGAGQSRPERPAASAYAARSASGSLSAGGTLDAGDGLDLGEHEEHEPGPSTFSSTSSSSTSGASRTGHSAHAASKK